MLSITEQIETRKLTCPISHQHLLIQGEQLQTPDGKYTYPLINGVPILLSKEKQEEYLNEAGGAMEKIYASISSEKQPSLRDRFFYKVDSMAQRGGDYRSDASRSAFKSILAQHQPGDLFLSIGGGPRRINPKLVNLNIDLFENVDVVGDAYLLPYADNSVDAIHCEAVLEHLEYPNQAVREMFRALKPGGQVFAATPFLQAFHAFPNHFQNFTQIGHQRLFERAGFDTISSGVCVGPTYTFVDISALYAQYLPTRVLSQLVPRIIRLLGSIIRPIDRTLNNRNSGAHILASTTYAHVVKPE